MSIVVGRDAATGARRRHPDGHEFALAALALFSRAEGLQEEAAVIR